MSRARRRTWLKGEGRYALALLVALAEHADAIPSGSLTLGALMERTGLDRAAAYAGLRLLLATRSAERVVTDVYRVTPQGSESLRTLPARGTRQAAALRALLTLEWGASVAVAQVLRAGVRQTSTAVDKLHRRFPHLVERPQRGVYRVTPWGRKMLEESDLLEALGLETDEPLQRVPQEGTRSHTVLRLAVTRRAVRCADVREAFGWSRQRSKHVLIATHRDYPELLNRPERGLYIPTDLAAEVMEELAEDELRGGDGVTHVPEAMEGLLSEDGKPLAGAPALDEAMRERPLIIRQARVTLDGAAGMSLVAVWLEAAGAWGLEVSGQLLEARFGDLEQLRKHRGRLALEWLRRQGAQEREDA